ncbi:hypothetical protein BH23CHL8_BH23CHL8_22590 [soil metagenome]
MAAQVHPGPVVHVWDHFVIGLRAANGGASLLSLYAVAWSPELGRGHICVLDLPNGQRIVIADPVAIGERMQARLGAMGFEPPGGRVPVARGSFSRPAADGDGLAWSIEFEGGLLEARWERLAAPFWVTGPAPAFRAEEDIWACFVAAGEASIRLAGEALPGVPYDDAGWQPRLGRSLSSAHAALAEVRVTPIG